MQVQDSNPVSLHHRPLERMFIPRICPPQEEKERETPQRSTTPGGSGGVGPSRRKHLSASNRC